MHVCILHNIKLQQNQDMADVNDKGKMPIPVETYHFFLTARATNKYLLEDSKQHNIESN